MSRLSLLVTYAAVTVAAFSAGVAFSRPARAEAPPTVVCTYKFEKGPNDRSLVDPVERWIAEQLVAGRKNVISVPMSVPALCAW